MRSQITGEAGFGPRRTLRRGLAAFCPVVVAGLLAAPAHAQEIKLTAQAKASHAEWLPYAPPPATPAAVCIVDTGVNLNADTTPVVTRRLSLDGGTLDDVDPGVHHGTLMAMMAASAANDTGMVGAAPGAVRIVSVRSAETPGPGLEPTSPFDNYRFAIQTCSKYHDLDGIQVIELALGSSGSATPDEVAGLLDRVIYAHDHNINVVAAAGNDGGPVNAPASEPGILAVGAGDQTGNLCSFSSRGDGLDLVAPGCALDTVDPITLEPRATQGTSQASAFAAGILAALRAYRPDLSWAQAEQALTSTAVGGNLNVESAFRSVGLGNIVDAGIAAAPKPPEAVQQPAAANGTGPALNITMTPIGVGASPSRWALPKIHIARYRQGTVSVSVVGAPKGAALRVILQRKRGSKWMSYKSLQTQRRTVRLRSSIRPGRVAVYYVDISGDDRTSATRYVTRLKR